ncbi:MAG TPA: peptidase S11, partial [Burkholderiales bacterium]
RLNNGKVLAYRNTNGLVKNDQWHIDVSKTGYISEAGRCLVMQARIAAKPVVIVLLDSMGKYTRTADANRVKKWVENQFARQAPG